MRAVRTIQIGLMIVIPAIACPVDTDAAAESLTIVAPAAPGGGWDQTARELQQVFARAVVGGTPAPVPAAAPKPAPSSPAPPTPSALPTPKPAGTTK